VAGCCEHGNEPSCSMKGGEFDKLSYYSFPLRTLLHGISWWMLNGISSEMSDK
jgi:hypothetical protein